MTPDLVAAVIVTATLCAVAGYVLYDRQERRHEAHAADLEHLLSQAVAARQDAEDRLSEFLGQDPESTALDEWEQRQFFAIAERIVNEREAS